jgi:dUTP pyrophosphatase
MLQDLLIHNKVLFKKNTPKAIIPTKAHDTDAGLDFYSVENRKIYPHTYEIIDTGISWEPTEGLLRCLSPFGIVLKLEPRSGLACKHGLEKGAGVIDQDYRGSIKVKLFNQSDIPYEVKEGDKICQGLVLPIIKVLAIESTELSETIRGKKGFGSSGT